jgi:hypothetical protein
MAAEPNGTRRTPPGAPTRPAGSPGARVGGPGLVEGRGGRCLAVSSWEPGAAGRRGVEAPGHRDTPETYEASRLLEAPVSPRHRVPGPGSRGSQDPGSPGDPSGIGAPETCGAARAPGACWPARLRRLPGCALTEAACISRRPDPRVRPCGAPSAPGSPRRPPGTGGAPETCRAARAPGACWPAWLRDCRAAPLQRLRVSQDVLVPASGLVGPKAPRVSRHRRSTRDMQGLPGPRAPGACWPARLRGLPGCALTEAACISRRPAPASGLAGALAPGLPVDPPGAAPVARLSRAGPVGPSGPS